MLQTIKKVANGISRVQSKVSYQIDLLRHSRTLPLLSAGEKAIVTACQQEGVCMTTLTALNISATAEMLKVADQLLAVMEDKAAHANQEQGTAEHPALPQIFTVADLPEFIAWAHDPKIMRIVENYVGLPVKFQGAHLRRDFANEKPVTTELWHRDDEDRRIIKVFIYLTDVGVENGPFEYVPRHRVARLKTRRILSKITASRQKMGRVGIDDAEMATLMPQSKWQACPCPPGTVVFADTRAVFHHGKSRRLSRSAIFLVYTAANPLHPEFCTQYHDRTFARPEPVGVTSAG
jgi:Phytanoyl-CoA dioxygenase (PhyH)